MGKNMFDIDRDGNISYEDKIMEHPIEDAKRIVEIVLIRGMLEKTGGNKAQAAKLLKISRPLLYQKLHRLGIE